jgi:hypothetical protein
MSIPKATILERRFRIVAILVAIAVVGVVGYQLTQRLRIGVKLNGDLTEVVRKVIRKETKVQSLRLVLHQAEASTTFFCDDPVILGAFSNLEEITDYARRGVGTMINGDLKVGGCTLPCSIVVHGYGISLWVMDGHFNDGSTFRFKNGSLLESWLRNQINAWRYWGTDW